MRLMLNHRKQYYRNVIIYKSYAKRFVVNQILISNAIVLIQVQRQESSLW